MMLSDVDIKKYLLSGDITIDPFTVDRLKGGSYTFTLGAQLFIPKKVACVDTKALSGDYDVVNIGKEGFVVNPGDFFLGHIKEKLSISTRLACMFDARTTLARIGLNVLQGSTLVEPGQTESHETLEISNSSKNRIKIYPGMNIVKGIFFVLNTPAEQNYGEKGTYSRQRNTPSVSS